jgi:hypothetical protein
VNPVLEPEGLIPNSLLKNGDWLRRGPKFHSIQKHRNVPVPRFQRAAKAQGGTSIASRAVGHDPKTDPTLKGAFTGDEMAVRNSPRGQTLI